MAELVWWYPRLAEFPSVKADGLISPIFSTIAEIIGASFPSVKADGLIEALPRAAKDAMMARRFRR